VLTGVGARGPGRTR